jgi:Cu+-exporting ATPase
MTLTLPVNGMSCASCVTHVGEALRSVDSVSEVNVNLAAKQATVTFDDDRAEVRDLVDAFGQTGYEIPVERVALTIEGMTCVSCVARVEGALSDVTGVAEVDVNLATKKASVEYVPGVSSHADLRLAVSKAGYQVLAGSAAASPAQTD